MENITYIIIGIIIGGGLTWFLARTRLQGIHSREMAELQAESSVRLSELEGRAMSAEAVVNELRLQNQQKDSDLNKLRNEIESERKSKVEALTRLEASHENLEAQRRLLETMKGDMTNTFNALSAAALKSSSEEFLKLASENLNRIVSDTKGRLGEHQVAMDGMIKPLNDALKRFDEQIRSIEESRHKAYGSLESQLKSMTLTQEQLQKETGNLVSALRKPQVRGRWGEVTLRRVAELSGMSGHCDFTEQLSVDTDKGRIRPDMIVHLPMNREIVVDSKVPLEAYLDAISVNTEDEKKEKMTRHTQHVRSHMNKLASKEYWSQFEKSPEFVVLFIPGESFLSPALEMDSTIIEDGIQKGVIIATPATFIALLRAIAYGWRQEQITDNVKQVSMLGKELYERISTIAGHFDDLGTAIGRGVDSYNKVIGSLELRVLPTVRKFKELGVTGGEDIPTLEQIDRKPRNAGIMRDLTESQETREEPS